MLIWLSTLIILSREILSGKCFIYKLISNWIDMDNVSNKNKQNKISSQEMKKKFIGVTNAAPKQKSIFYRINPVIIITAVILAVFLSFQFFTRNSTAYKISLNELISGIKDDRFSQVTIENNGRIVAEENSFFILDSNNNLDFNKSGVKYVNYANSDFETLDLNSFIKQLNGNNDLVTQVRSALNRGGDIREIVLGSNYLIGMKSGTQKDILVVNITPDQFYSKLKDNNLTVEKLSIPIKNLTAFGVTSTTDSISDKLNSSQISNVYVLENGVTVARLRNEYVRQYYIDWTPVISTFTTLLQEEGIPLNIDTVQINPENIPSGLSFSDVLTVITLLGLGVLAVMLFRGMQGSSMGIMQFGQSKAKVFFGAKPDVTFKDVAGIDEAREELNEIVDFLREPNKYRKLGARIPKGVLMVGAPGTGKTLLARAIAGEAGVPFFHTSGSEFEEMLVGAGASRVRDLFAKAKKAAPALIFIDEIDAVARKRGTRVQSGTTEQTLNQILVEMDGFEKNVNVIILAATNRPDVLDPAILRPGRFDRQIRIELPDMEGRKEILAVHGKNKPFEESVDLEKIARRTVGFTGADLENILNEAAIIAAKEGKKQISMHDIEEAVSKVVLGPAKKSRKRTDKEVQLVAYHEAGHAVVAKYTPESTPVDKISIVSRGSSGGVTMFTPEKDEYINSRRKLLANIVVGLGGRAAEEVALDDISTGASSDIEQATSIAKRMVQQFGMSEKLGLVRYGDFADSEYLGYGYSESKDFSEKTAEEIDLEVRTIIMDCYKQARQILLDNRDKLDRVANELLDKEVLGKEEFEALF